MSFPDLRKKSGRKNCERNGINRAGQEWNRLVVGHLALIIDFRS